MRLIAERRLLTSPVCRPTPYGVEPGSDQALDGSQRRQEPAALRRGRAAARVGQRRRDLGGVESGVVCLATSAARHDRVAAGEVAGDRRKIRCEWAEFRYPPHHGVVVSATDVIVIMDPYDRRPAEPAPRRLQRC
jgi:hypothetical protein